MNHLVLRCIENFHVKWTHGPTAISCAAIIVFNGPENFLALCIFHRKFVVRLEANEGLQQFDFLFDQQLVNCRQIFEAGRTIWDRNLRRLHPIVTHATGLHNNWLLWRRWTIAKLHWLTGRRIARLYVASLCWWICCGCWRVWIWWTEIKGTN